VDLLPVIVTIALLASIAAGTGVAVRADEPATLLVAAMMFGTAGTAVLLVLAEPLDQPALRDAALVLVALATLVVLVYVHRGRPVGSSHHRNR
jgi:multicomponent Na+:H+ antiporter subunit F